VPAIYLEELSRLHDQVPPFPTRQVRRRIQDELHAPLDTIFDSFNEEPLAAASLGQVHRARYRGHDVIVKVLRPGVEELVDTDVRIVRNLAFIIEQFIEHHTVRAAQTIIDEFSRVISEEMNFQHEADNIERFADYSGATSSLFRRSTGKSRQRAVMEFLKVFVLPRWKRSSGTRSMSKMIQNLIEFYGDQLLIYGFHADPHRKSADQQDARIVLLDYGMVLEIPRLSAGPPASRDRRSVGISTN
jgi:ubiquinone biosynthesis protein